MDKQLEDLQARLGECVEIRVEEHPLTNLMDAIRIGRRAGVIYRFAENGPNFEIRWTLQGIEGGGSMYVIPSNALPVVIAEKIIERCKPEYQPPVPEPAITPAAKELADEYGALLIDIEGTGAHGKIVIDDVRDYILAQEHGD